MNKKSALHTVRPVPSPGECPDCSFIDWGRRADFSADELQRFCDRIEHRRLKKITNICIAPDLHWACCT